MADPKFCPKCLDEPQTMGRLTLALGMPITVEALPSSFNLVPQSGLPVRACECPRCGLVELYRHRA
jgi:hypothetical protein